MKEGLYCAIPTAAGWHSNAIYNEELGRDIETRSHVVSSILWKNIFAERRNSISKLVVRARDRNGFVYTSID